MPTWPQNVFPNPDGSFAAQSATTTIRTKMEGGRSRQRSRFSQEVRAYNAVWTFTDVQYLMFQTYLANTLNNGTVWFEILLPNGDNGLQSYTARFKDGIFKSNYVPVLHWRVSATLEVEDVPLLTDEVMELLLAINGDVYALEAAANLLYILVEETLTTLF